MTSDFDIDSILKDSDEMMANMRGQKFKPSEKFAATQQPHELDKYLVDADEMMGNLHGQKPKKENSPEHVESFRDTLFPEGGWGLKRGLESALGPEKRPDTVAAALHQIGFGNINEQQKAIADSVTDPVEIAEFPAWHEKTPEQREIAYQHSKKEYTAGDVWDTAKGALASLGGLGESAVMGAGKAAYDLGPGVVEMNLRMAGAKSEEEKKRIENEYSQRFANVFRSVPEAFGQVGHEVGSIVEQGKAAGFPMVDRLASKFGMMSDDTRREHFMVRDALKTHDAQVSAQNPSMTGRMAKSAYRALIDWTGPSIEDILHMHPEFKGDREKAKAFKDKESKKKTDEALGQWINEMNTHPVDPDVMTLPTLIPLAEGLPAANMFALGERTLAGALDLSTAARRVASGMTRAEWGAAQLAKAEAKLADSAAKASELGRVGRAAGYLVGKGEQAIQAGEQALGKVEQAGEAAKAEYDRIFENAPEKMRGYLEKSMPVLGAAGVGGAIGALADPESELKGAAKGALFGAAALQVPRLAYDIARASAKNAGGTAGVFGTLAKDADSGWGARMLVGNGIPPQGGNWMQTMLARRPQVFDWMVNNTKDMANSAIHITPMAVTLGMLDSNDPKGFVDSMLQGWAWAVGPQLYHKALGKDPFQSARERKQYDHQVYKFKSTLSEETLKRMNHFADIGTEVQSAKDHLDLVTQDYQKATEGKEKGAEMTPEEQVHGILVAKARLRYEAALRNASTPEGKNEYAKQFWYRMADIDAHISGAIEPGKNVKVELMTTDDMLDKLGKSNMKGFEALGGPVPQKPLSQWGPEDLNTLSPEQQAYYTKLKFFSEAEGVNYLRSHTRVHNGERIDKQNGKHVIWEPEMEKGTVALNADVIFDNMINNGDAFLSVYSHEMGHALDGFDEHKKRSATLRKKLFGEEMKDASGNTIGQIPGLYDDKHLFDLFQIKYGKSNANLTPEQVAEKMGFYDPDTNAYNVKGIVDMMKDEVMADMNSTGFYRNYFFNRPKGAAALVDWMTVKDQNSKLSRLARRMAGLQPDMPVFGERSGAMFTPEVQRMADQHMREMRALHGDMMPHNPEETIVPPIDKKDIIANKELSDYYLTDTGRFKTEMAGIVYDAEGNKVAEIVLQDPEISEGSWFHHTNEAGESSITQGHGDGEMPPELEKIPIPMGGHAMSTHRLMRDPSGKPIENDTKATRELINLRSQMVRDAIDNAGDVGAPGRLRPVSPGSNSYRGQLTDAQMEAIRRLPNRVVPYSIKQKLFDINKSLAKNDGTRLLLDYATRIDAKGNYVPFSPKIVDVVPIGMMFSTDGHFLMTGVSVSRMMSKLDRWEAFMPARLKPWNGSKNKFMEEIVGSYLENHSKGHPGSGYAEDGTPVEGAKKLAPTQAEAEAKRDIFNDFFNMYDSSTVDRNPDRTELPKLKLTREQRKEDNLVKLTKEAKKLERSSNQNTMVRSFRLDSIMDMAVSDLVKIPVDYYKVKMNASLEARAREQEQKPRLEAIPDVLSRMNMRYTPRSGEAAEPRFSVLSREPARMDAEHAAAHEAGDEEKARMLVRDAAKAAGYEHGPMYHASYTDFNEFLSRADQAEAAGEHYEPEEGGDAGNLGTGFYFTPDKAYAKRFGSPREFFLKGEKVLNAGDPEIVKRAQEIYEELVDERGGASNGEVYDELMDEMKAAGIYAEGAGGLSYGSPEMLIKASSQVKSADPFTYDNAGKLIPLSERFNPASSDIRFSISGGNPKESGDFAEKEEYERILNSRQSREGEVSRAGSSRNKQGPRAPSENLGSVFERSVRGKDSESEQVRGETESRRASEAAKRAQDTRLVDAARQHGALLDHRDFLERWRASGYKSGAEHQVILGNENGKVEKRTNIPMFEENWGDYFDRIRLHNEFFPETKITVKGIHDQAKESEANVQGNFSDLVTGRVTGSDPGAYVVTEQPYVKILDPLSINQIDSYLNQRNFFRIVRGNLFEFYNPKAKTFLRDAHEGNVVSGLGPDGKEAIFVIDVPMRYANASDSNDIKAFNRKLFTKMVNGSISREKYDEIKPFLTDPSASGALEGIRFSLTSGSGQPVSMPAEAELSEGYSIAKTAGGKFAVFGPKNILASGKQFATEAEAKAASNYLSEANDPLLQTPYRLLEGRTGKLKIVDKKGEQSFSKTFSDSAEAADYAIARHLESMPLEKVKKYMPKGDRAAIDGAIERIAKVQAEYPESVPLEVTRDDKTGLPKIDLLEDADENPILDENGKQMRGVIFKKVAYELRKSPKLDQNDHAKAVQQAADIMEPEAKLALGLPSIAKAIGWYQTMRKDLQRGLGASIELFGQLLGATSARTPVDTNFLQSREAAKMFSKGEYDDLLGAFDKWIKDSMLRVNDLRSANPDEMSDSEAQDALRKEINKFPDMPLRPNGKKFNANSQKVLHALYGNWLEQTVGPKTPNFAGNLTGRTLAATIDVWAARNARRLLYNGLNEPWRILPEQEQGVQSSYNKQGQLIGDFPFMQDVYQELGKRLKMNPDDLQALNWFFEKDVWEKNGWTGTVGAKKSSFEEEAAKVKLDRYQVGLTAYTNSDQYPELDVFKAKEQEALRKEVRDSIAKIDGLEISRVTQTVGLYGGDQEPSLDIEFSVAKGKGGESRSIKPFIETAIKKAKENNQYDVFVSHVVDQNHPNARPIVEIGFKRSASPQEIDLVTSAFRAAGIDGFTVASDQRGGVIGIRAQYIPEFSARYDRDNMMVYLDPANHPKNAKDWTDKVASAITSISSMDHVSYAAKGHVSTLVYGKEEYDQSKPPENLLRSHARSELGRRRVLLEKLIESERAAAELKRQPELGQVSGGSNPQPAIDAGSP